MFLREWHACRCSRVACLTPWRILSRCRSPLVVAQGRARRLATRASPRSHQVPRSLSALTCDSTLVRVGGVLSTDPGLCDADLYVCICIYGRMRIRRRMRSASEYELSVRFRVSYCTCRVSSLRCSLAAALNWLEASGNALSAPPTAALGGSGITHMNLDGNAIAALAAGAFAAAPALTYLSLDEMNFAFGAVRVACGGICTGS